MTGHKNWRDVPIDRESEGYRQAEHELSEELAEEREKMFELFLAGYTAVAREHVKLLGPGGTGFAIQTAIIIGEARQAFDAWLQEQVEEVDTTFLRDSKAEAARELAEHLEGQEFTITLSDATEPEDLFGPLEDFIERPPAWGPNEQGRMMLDMPVEDFQADMRRVIERMRERLGQGHTTPDT